MPPALHEYTVADWRRLRPLFHGAKTFRYRLVNAVYVRRAAPHGNRPALEREIRARKVLVTVAFNDPQVLKWQAVLVRHYVPHALHIVADNSSDRVMAAKIAAVAEQERVRYLRLPANPWSQASRSHGIALNWLWRNLIRPGEPEAFGFLDHDLFPLAPDDPFAPLSSQDFFGVVRTAGPRWFLWAGFCMFRFDSVKHKPLDFGQDWFAGLDTGGGNWGVLYRHLDRDSLTAAPVVSCPYKPGIDANEGPLQWFASWVHEVGQMGRPELQADRRRALARILAPHLTAAQPRTVVFNPDFRGP